MSTDLLHHWYVEQQTELPNVQRNNPLVNWRRVWQNIALRGIAAPQRSELYVIVNEKTVHRRLLHIMHRTDGEDCEHCGAAIETVQHKFSECPRVLLAWEDQRKVPTNNEKEEKKSVESTPQETTEQRNNFHLAFDEDDRSCHGWFQDGAGDQRRRTTNTSVGG
ncbi:pol-like protein [Culex quinquefasciatus]|uniref:Pol-like protein n=1 Tax=Culex quinquefasciatus TaxID=7176 RepID=B0WY47_CULQU|nr:pol-like protein [Culex quinquefasciatus]|eukprot:XP_001862319.1 pol-like protein [Culex quinquefasciatus]